MIFKIFIIIFMILNVLVIGYLFLIYSRLSSTLYYPINNEDDLISFLSAETNKIVEYNSTLKRFGFYNKDNEFIVLVVDQGETYSYHPDLSPYALIILDHYFEDININME